jgi:hypothetical protein
MPPFASVHPRWTLASSRGVAWTQEDIFFAQGCQVLFDTERADSFTQFEIVSNDSAECAFSGKQRDELLTIYWRKMRNRRQKTVEFATRSD